MSKTNKARKEAKAVSATETVTPKSPTEKASRPSKQGILVALMQRADGATLDEMVKATSWQPHSVRGVISGVLKKKPHLTVASTKGTYGTVYRIVKEEAVA